MKNNTIFLFLAAFFCFYTTKAQTADDIGKIALSVVIPENVDGLTVSQLSKLESKITRIITNTGLAASGFNQTFVIYPKFALYETETVEGGMQNITIVTVELSLFIKQVSTNLLFSSVNKKLKGSGKTKEIAITNAIAQIPVSDKNFTAFLSEGKEKILRYYEQNCEDIIKKADAFIQMQQYEPALGLLMSVPQEVSACYEQIINKSIDTYKAYQKQHCSEQLQQARTASAAMDYEEALNILAEIDPSTNCFAEAQKMVASLENKVNTEYMRQWDFKIKLYNDEVALNRQRINAIKEIAVSFYNSQPKSVNHHYNIMR